MTSAGGDAVGVGQLAPDPLEQAGGERLVAEDRARLHGDDRVAADRPIRGAQLDPRQLGGPRRERLEAELEPGRDGAADVGAVGGHAVERRRRPEVDDDRRRAVQPRGGQRVDQPVGADVARPVDPDRRSAPCPARPTMSGRSRRSAMASTRRGQRRHDRGQGDRVEVAERHPVQAEQPVEQQLELVGRRPRVGRRAPRGEQRTGAEQRRS